MPQLPPYRASRGGRSAFWSVLPGRRPDHLVGDEAQCAGIQPRPVCGQDEFGRPVGVAQQHGARLCGGRVNRAGQFGLETAAGRGRAPRVWHVLSPESRWEQWGQVVRTSVVGKRHVQRVAVD
ncbi:hypothetical protein SLAVM298S_03178 [Streptomyces lavendulae subsp. lavendulae]